MSNQTSADWVTLAAHGGALLGAKFSCELRIQHLNLRVKKTLEWFPVGWLFFWGCFLLGCGNPYTRKVSYSASQCIFHACLYCFLIDLVCQSWTSSNLHVHLQQSTKAQNVCVKNSAQTMLCSKESWSRGLMPRWHLTLLTVEDWGGAWLFFKEILQTMSSQESAEWATHAARGGALLGDEFSYGLRTQHLRD